jgi:hypothetical protein
MDIGAALIVNTRPRVRFLHFLRFPFIPDRAVFVSLYQPYQSGTMIERYPAPQGKS